MKHVKSLVAAAIVSSLAVALGCGGSSDNGSTTTTDAGGTNSDASTSKDSGTTGDSSTPHNDVDGGVACGQSSCNPSTEQCCIAQSGASCIGKSDTCQGTSLACTTTAQCTGSNVCCATLSGTSITAVCQASCPSGGITGPYQLCASDAECPAGSTCQTIGNIHYCGTPFDASAFDASGFFDAARD
jgi:hypothetical protein